MQIYKGIDVSTFQGQINWQRVKESGIQFAMIRGGYGRSMLDDRYNTNYIGAKTVGIPVGVYHYSYATSKAHAKDEAEFVLKYLRDRKFEYPIALDIEDRIQRSLSKRTVSAIVKTFCETVEKAGYYVVIYSSKSFLLNKIDVSLLKRYDVWCAQWANQCDYPYSYGMWQYSDKGRVDGISGNVDLDQASKHYPTIIKKAGLNGFSKDNNDAVKKPETILKGQSVKLNHALIYSSSTTTKSSGSLSGTYYIYDGKNCKGRYRITNTKQNCGRQPMSLYVTGWINKKDVI